VHIEICKKWMPSTVESRMLSNSRVSYSFLEDGLFPQV